MKVNTEPRPSLFGRKVPLPYLFGAIVITAFLTYIKVSQSALNASSSTNSVSVDSFRPRTIHQIRLKDYEFTRPLVLTDLKEDAPDLADLKSEITQLINQRISTGELESASVYVRRLNDSRTIRINPSLQYNPGSTAKVSILITYLKEAEKNPALLRQVYSMGAKEYVPIKQYFPSEELIPGKSYTVKELLYYMIVKSCNSATMVLTNHINTATFSKLYSDLGIGENITLTNTNFVMRAEDISDFMRVLYNASYLNAENSDYALHLLSETEFNKGIVSALPASSKIAHKFGEQGNNEFRQLHETAIVYLDNAPYLLTIMTKGKDMDKLPAVLGDISKIVYNRFNANI